EVLGRAPAARRDRPALPHRAARAAVVRVVHRFALAGRGADDVRARARATGLSRAARDGARLRTDGLWQVAPRAVVPSDERPRRRAVRGARSLERARGSPD